MFNIFYVYSLCRPDSDQPFYNGKGKGKRAEYHTNMIKDGKRTDNPHKDNIIAKILKEGKEPTITIIQAGMAEDAAFELEETLIKQYGRSQFDINGILSNITGSGRPPPAYGCIKDHKGIKNPNFGKKHPGLCAGSDHWSANISTEQHPNYGSKRSLETKEKQRAIRKGRSYEELYGAEKAQELRIRKSKSMMGKNKKP